MDKVLNKLYDWLKNINQLKIIYELKPYNKRNIRQGINQLYRYQNVIF